MKVISLASHKGGSGKTVSALAISSALARAGHKTLLLDLDPQGHSSIGIGVELVDGDLTIRNIFSRPSSALERIIRPTHLEKLDVAPSNITLDFELPPLYAKTKRHVLLAEALSPIRRRYSFVVIDTHPSLGPLTENAIEAADLVLIPVMMEARTPDAIVDLLELIALLKGEKFDNWRILFTRVDSRKTVTNEVVTKAISAWKRKILKTVIPQSEPLNQAQMAKTDIFSFDSKSKGALAYEVLMEELILL